MGEADWNPTLESSDESDGLPSVAMGATQGEDWPSPERDGALVEVSATSSREQQDVRDVDGSPPSSPATVPVPASPPLSVKAPSPSVLFGSTSARESVL